MDSRFPDLEIANQVSATISLIVISTLELIVFAKLRFKMDRPVIVLLLTFIIILIQRKVEDFFEDPPLVVTILAPLASIISYALLYYFVFEMMFMVSTIKSMTHVDRMKRDRRIKNTEITLFSLYIGVYVPCTLIGHSLYNSNPQFYFDNLTLFRINQGVRSAVKLPLDSYMIYEFLKSYFYFV